MRLILATIFVLASIGLTTPCWSQGDDRELDRLRSELSVRKQAMVSMDQELAQLRMEKTSGFAKAVESYHGSLVDFYTYQNDLRQHAQSVLNWQLVSSYTLLLLVVVVTGLGVTLSFLEVRSALNIPARVLQRQTGTSADSADDTPEPGGDGGPGQPAAPAPTTLQISPQSLQVTSAVTGVVILVISLAFLYLFIARVLELQPVDLVTSHRPAEISDDESKSRTPGEAGKPSG